MGKILYIGPAPLFTKGEVFAPRESVPSQTGKLSIHAAACASRQTGPCRASHNVNVSLFMHWNGYFSHIAPVALLRQEDSLSSDVQNIEDVLAAKAVQHPVAGVLQQRGDGLRI